MKHAIVIFLLSAVFQSVAQELSMQQLITDNFRFAQEQYQVLAQNIAAEKMPQGFIRESGKVDSRDITWWCSGFYPGSLWLIYEQTQDAATKREAERALKVIEPNRHFTGNHDLGFMVFCSFGNAYRLTQSNEYKQVILDAAEALSTRYRPEIQSIQSWNKSKQWNCPVIIDNMMNLEMMNWASEVSGNRKFKDIAVKHSNTTLKNHFRPDYSSYHVVDYDLEEGKVKRKATWQGASDNSSWSRGQAWALYGFTNMYRDTKDKRYLKQAEGIAQFLLNHPNLPEDKIPFWDFDAPKIPFAVRDASAGAIMASALLELAQFTFAENKKRYVRDAETMIRSLASKAYRSPKGANGGFLLDHSTGAYSLDSEIDQPIIYADYYFLEAMKRFKDWYL